MSKSKFIWKMIATCGGLGFLRPGPGTWTSCVAALFWYGLAYWGVQSAGLLSLSVLVTALGSVSVQKTSGLFAKEDASEITIDEWAGVGFAISFCPVDWRYFVVALVLFRIFDISKPPGVSYFDRNHLGGWGVMLDDVVAGLYSAALIGLYIYYVSPRISS